MIFTNGSGAQTPGASQPGIEFSGKVSWDGSSSTVTAVNCNIQQPIPVESVTISGNGVSDGKLSLKVGASAQLTATVKPDNATNKTVSWDSSDNSVAKVSDGKVTALKAGTATITATAGDISSLITVTVADVPVPVTSVSVSGDGVSGGKLSLKSGGFRAADRDGQARQRDGPQGHVDELGLERRERDGHGRGHRRLEGRQGHGHRDRGRQERVRRGHGRGAGSVRATGRFGEGPRVGSGGRHVHGVYRVEGRHGPGRGRRVEVRPGQRAAGRLERRREPEVEGVARLEGLRDALERELRQGPGRGGRFREERRERAAVLVERRPQPEVGRGPVRFVVPPGVRDVAVAGPGGGGLVHEERRERGCVDVERRREPAMEVR